MVTAQNTGYVNIGGQRLGQPITSPYNPIKHVESASFDRVIGKEDRWLGILNIVQNYNMMKLPFLSMTEMQKNVLEVDGTGSTFTFGVPFKTGCPYLLENLCKDVDKPGLGNQPFFIVLSENVYDNGDIITTDFRNGRQLRIQTVEEKGKDAEIIPYLSGYRYMVALDSLDEDMYYPQEFLEIGIPYFKAFSIDASGEFGTYQSSSYSGRMTDDNRTALQLYQYTVGYSKQAIDMWITADSTYRQFNVEGKVHPAVAHLNGASTDVIEFWTGTDKMKKGVFWIPQFILNMGKELAKMKENFLMFSQGNSIITNGREKIVTGLGVYQQIKQRGNYDTYTDFRQLYNLIRNFSERLFSMHNHIHPKDRFVRLRCGRLAYDKLRQQFGEFFKTHNQFTVLADHPALIKAGMIKTDEKGGIIYKPLQFNAIEFPEQGTIFLEYDDSLERMDEYLEVTPYAGYVNRSSGMIFIEDITDGNFSNAIPTGLKENGKTYKNITLIKQRNYVDKTEYLVGRDCNDKMLKQMGVPNANMPVVDKKGLRITMTTEGEAWVQDPSRCWILEYDPDGVIANTSIPNFSYTF